MSALTALCSVYCVASKTVSTLADRSVSWR